MPVGGDGGCRRARKRVVKVGGAVGLSWLRACPVDRLLHCRGCRAGFRMGALARTSLEQQYKYYNKLLSELYISTRRVQCFFGKRAHKKVIRRGHQSRW